MNTAILYNLFLKSTGVCTDTRKLEKGNLFFALRGPNFNANAFATKALEQGAAAVVIDDPAYFIEDDQRYFVAEDALKALQDLALHHRKQLNIPVIGLTGSNGKTTTKELMHAVLKRKFKTQATVGNLNNHIGVPLTILAIGSEVEVAIVEMGANKPGDIKELCDIALPTHGLITNIGKAHLEGMGGFDGVLKTKTELYQHLISNRGKVFINSSNPILSQMIKRFEEPVLYPQKADFYFCEFISANPMVVFKTAEGSEHTTNMLGAYNFDNIATALCVGVFFGVEEAEAIAAVCAYQPANMRSQVLDKRSNRIILDAYNANPSSMEVAIRAFGEMSGKKHKMVILGDMFELGATEIEEHQRIGELVSEYDFDKVCFTGNLIQHALKTAPRALYFPDPFSLRNWLEDSRLEDHLILIKGSRGMKLEGLVDFI
jgi:UDP-N-acetylmuramoyl-tripeptide--D-alanyl-D-alanine ligase